MSNPIYKGTGQLIAGNGNGLLGRLGSIFGGVATPTYRGDGQPSPGSGGFFGSVTPAYKVTPKVKPVDGAQAQIDADAQALERPIIAIDPDALAAGSIAVVIPRDLCAPRDLCVMQGGDEVTQQ